MLDLIIRNASIVDGTGAPAYDADVLVGFAYGYTGERGQWWSDSRSGAVVALIAKAATNN